MNHYIINPIFKVYEMTKDKEDFLENIKLTYKVIYKGENKKISSIFDFIHLSFVLLRNIHEYC